MTYVDYEYYSTIYGGTDISKEEFARLEIKSRAQIDRYTFRRVQEAVKTIPNYNIPSEIKNAQCELMEYLKKYDENGGAVASESVSKHSVTYLSKNFDGEVRGIINSALGGTPWIYRGGGIHIETGQLDNPIQYIPK